MTNGLVQHITLEESISIQWVNETRRAQIMFQDTNRSIFSSDHLLKSLHVPVSNRD